MRRSGRLRTLGTFVLARYDDVAFTLKSRAFGVDLIPRAIEKQAEKLGITDVGQDRRFIRNSLVFTDNPAHVRLRRLLNRVFTPEALGRLRPLVEASVHELLDALPVDGFDLVRGVAQPLPNNVLCRWMAVPREDAGDIARHIHSVRLLLDPGVAARAPFQGALASLAHLVGYFHRHAARLRVQGDDRSLLAALAAARFEEQGLSEEEIAFACVMCFVAGGETTQGLVGNTLHLLMSHPAQWEQLCDDPHRWVGAAIEEATRHETPLQLTKRLAMESTAIDGEPVHAGEQIGARQGSCRLCHAAFC